MRVLCYNAQGLVAEADCIRQFASDNLVDLVLITETWLFEYDSTILNNVILNIAEPTSNSRRGRRATGGIMACCFNADLKNEFSIVHTDIDRHYALLKVLGVFICVIYLPPSADDTKLTQILDNVLNIAQTNDIIICGDINARLGRFADDHALDSRGKVLLSYLEDNPLYLQTPSEGRYTCFSTRFNSLGILGRGIPEHVLSNGILVTNYRIFEDKPLGTSDHRPILFDIVLNNAPDKAFERWNVRKLTDAGVREAYLTAVTEAKSSIIQHINDSITSTDAWEHFKTDIGHIIDDCCGRIRYNSRTHREFWTPELKTARNDILKLTVELQNIADNSRVPLVVRQGAMQALTAKKREYRQMVMERRKHVFQQMADNMSDTQNYSSLMKYVKCCKSRREGGGCALDPDQIDHHSDYYRSTFGAAPCGNVLAYDGITPDDLYNPYFGWEPVVAPGVAAGHPNPGLGMAGLTPDTTQSEYVPRIFNPGIILDQLKRLALGKAAGIDNIMAEFLVYGAEPMAEILNHLFNKISNDCCIPQDWRESLIVPVYKKRGDINNISNYRPIALTCITRRLYERLLKLDIDFYLGQLEDTQGGFRSNRSTLQQVYVLQELKMKYPSMKMILMDMKAAYDMVDRRILWYKLRHDHNMPPSLIARLKDLFDFNISYLVVKGKRSQMIINKRGLLQGSSLSPILFNFYINNLLADLHRNTPKIIDGGLSINHLAFADDLVLLGKSKIDVQILLRRCQTWAQNQGMEFSPTKCVAIDDATNSELFLYDVELPVERHSKYLGVTFDKHGIDWPTHFQSRINKAKKIILMLQNFGMNITGIAPAASINLYRAFIRPVFEYGAALRILPQKLLEALQKTQNMALRTILSGNRSTSINAMHKLLLMEKFARRNEILNMSFIGRLHNSTDGSILAVKYYRNKIQEVGATLLIRNTDSLTKIGRSNPIWNRATMENILFRTLNRALCIPQPALSVALKKKLKMEDIMALDRHGTNIAGAIEVDENETIRYHLKAAAFSGGRRRRVTYSRWLIGAVANHQTCQLCQNAELSREHALECAQINEEMDATYGEHFGDDYSTRGLTKLDYLMNKFRKNAPANWETNSTNWIAKILRLCRGFQQAGNGFWSPQSEGIG